MEQLDLTTPVTWYRVSRLSMDWPAQHIWIRLAGPNGEDLAHTYVGAQATALMTALNKANLSTKSLHKRIIEQLVADGVLAGTISGSPE